MADLKLVGAVAIKVRPDATGFRESAEKQVKDEARKLEADVNLNAKLKGEEAKKDGKKLQEELDGKTVTWNVKLDHDSVRAAQKKLDSIMEPTHEIKFKVGDKKSMAEAAARLEELAKKAKVKITYSNDEKGYQQVLDKIAAIRREKLEKTIHFGTSDAELDKLEKDMKSKLAKAAGDKLEIKGTSKIKFEYDENRAGLEQLIADIDKQLAKFKDQQIYVTANKESLLEARRLAEEGLKTLPIIFEYEENRAGIEKAIKEIDAQLAALKPKAKIESMVDEKSLLEAREKLQAELEEIQQTITFAYNLNRSSLEKAIAEVDAAIESLHEIEIEVGLNEFELAWVKADLEAALARQPVKLEYNNNKAGLQKAVAEIDAVLEKIHPKIKIEVAADEAALKAERARLQEEIDNIEGTIKLSYNLNRKSLQKAIDEVNAAIDKIHSIDLEVNLNEFELAWIKADLEAAASKIPVEFEYDRNVAGLKKAIAEIDAELAKHAKAKIEATLDPLSLSIAKAQLEDELSHQTVQFEYEENLESLKAARAKIRALMSIDTKLHIDAELNDVSLAEALAKVDEMIKAATPEVKPKVKPHLMPKDYFKVATQLAILTKSQTVDIFVKLNNASVLLAAGKLTGLRAAGRWTEGFARSLGSLDRNLPIVAAAVLGINTLTSGFLTLTAGAFSLGNGLGEVVRMATLMAPAMILGFAAAKTVFTGVFKDFGAAVNGDKTAIKKLTESGKEAAANMRQIFQDMREAISNNFWDTAGDSMLRFTKTALPAVKTGMEQLATSMAGVFNGVVNAFSTFAEQNGIDVFFTNLIGGFDKVANGMAPFMSAFLNLSVLGSTAFPRLGAAFDEMSQKFDKWVTDLALDGSFSRWIDQGIQGIKDLWGAGVSLVKIWGDIGQAGQAAGAMTLHSFAGSMAKLEEVTSGFRFQDNLKNIFEGAREASDSFHEALKKLGPAMDIFSVTVQHALANSGSALEQFVYLVGDILSSSNLDRGLTAFLEGVKTMFVELRPAAAPISEIIGTLGEVLGAVARDSGPLFRTLFTQLATVLNVAWHALEPFLPSLIQVGTTIVSVLGPALASAANVLIPAFATAVVKIGDGLIPVIKALADFAVGVAGMVSGLPIPVLAGLVSTILAINGAFTFTSAVAPLAAAAMEAYGVAAATAALRSQLMIPVVGLALAALTGLVAFGITGLVTGMKSGTPYANEYATALREDAKAAGELDDALGAAGTKVALKKLYDSGAYDAAKKLGISTWEVTDAVIHGGKAMEKLQAKLNGVDDAYKAAAESAQTGTGATEQYAYEANEGVRAMQEQKDAADKLRGATDDNANSIAAARGEIAVMNELEKEAGINTEDHAEKVNLLTQALKASSTQVNAAAAASGVLNDAFSSTASKVDAMRKTFDILLGKDAKQAAAETLGAYASGFNNLKETVTPLAGKMQELGDAVYGENGFLNIAGGNKAVMQVNQALVDEVNNVWSGAKAAYDAAIQQGKGAKAAFEDAQKFVSDHKGDYNALAEASGVSADRVQGQWEAVFGHEWVLQVSLQGATEAAAMAQAMIQGIKGNFDGKKFMAWLDANPDMAMKATYDAEGVARSFVNSEWKAVLDALPEPAKEALKNLKGLTLEQWNKGDFEAILNVAQSIPGLPEALVAMKNGASNNGQNWQAIFYAVTNGISVEAARKILDDLAAARTARIDAIVYRSDAAREDLNGAASGNGRMGTIAHGGFFRQMRAISDLFSGRFQAGRPTFYANGGMERHVAQIAKGGPVRIWAEPETQGEAYIPLASSKRPRSLAILNQVAKEFGYSLTKSSQAYAAGGLEGHASPTTTTNASVSIGTLYTTDPDEAVRKIRNSQVDALAVAGITLNGA